MKSVRLDFIDALRGLAACYVVMFHLALLPQPNLALPDWLRLFVLNGGAGVVLFFVLSAFTMCLTMQRRRGEKGAVRHFYLRRFFRIAPLFYALLFVTLIFDRVMFGQLHSPAEFLLSLVFGFNLSPDHVSGIVRASWTIGVEMLFYLIFPLIFSWVNQLSRAVVFLGLSLLLAHLHTLWLLSFMTDALTFKQYNHMNLAHQMPVFALGMCVYFIYIKVDLEARMTRWLGAGLLLAGVFGYYQMMHGVLPDFGLGLYWQALIFSLILLGIGFTSPVWVVNQLTRFLGKISYSIYLNHPVLILLIMPVFHKLYQFPFNKGWLYAASLFCIFTVLIPVSMLSFRYVEAKGIEYSRRFS